MYKCITSTLKWVHNVLLPIRRDLMHNGNYGIDVLLCCSALCTELCHDNTLSLFWERAGFSALPTRNNSAVEKQRLRYFHGAIPRPQSPEYFRSNHATHVITKQVQNEDAVPTQAAVRERVQNLGAAAIFLIRQCRHLVSNVRRHVTPEQRTPRPLEEACCGDGGDGYEPEPEQDEYLLIEQVDRENALDDVAVCRHL